jgi:translation initiation factor IF-1
MPGVTARSAAKNQSKSARAKDAKNARRVEAAIADNLIGCTYGRITRTLGNKMFRILDTKRDEHLGHIRGKMARINLNDIVLLNIRDYESRAQSEDAVYDIMAVFKERKDLNRLIKTGIIPAWLIASAEGEDDDNIFDYSGDSDEDAATDDENGGKVKKSQKRKAAVESDVDSEVDVDRI